jgi:flagellar hook-associated protein 1 FlgK
MAGLNVALSSAVSSLLLLEKQMGVVSNNIANANTTGYTVETVQVASNVTGGVGTGVTDLGTVSEVSKYLQDSVLQANTTSTQATAFSTLYQDLENALGTVTSDTTGGDDISSQLGTLESALSTMATTPQDSAYATNVVQDLGNLTTNLNSLSTEIQSLRTTADSEISQTVDDANTQLNTINSLNKQISTAQGLGESTAALSDLRMEALNSLSGDLGVNYYINSNGAMQIYTTSGQQLLVGDNVNELSHTAVTTNQNMSYSNGSINGIMVGDTDITSDITSGTLAGLIQQRDTELPNAQNELNTLAQSLSTTLNKISNQGTADPAPTTLTSATGTDFSGTDAVTAAAGTSIRIAVVDSSGNVQQYTNVDLSTATSIGPPTSTTSVLYLIKTALTSAGVSATCTLNGSGQLVLSSTASGDGIAVSTTSGSLATTGGTGTDFSSFFHLNDIITAGTSAATISVNPTLLTNADLFPTATLTTTAGATTPYSGIGSGDGTTASALESALLADNSFTANTATGTTAESSLTTALDLSGSFTIKGTTGSNVTVTVTSTMTLTDIAAAINTAASGTSVTAKVTGTGAYQLQISTGSSSLSFSNVSGNVLSSLGLSSSPSGYLGATSTTFAGYASSIISDVATRASNASTAATAASTTLTTMQSNLSSQSGVNTDEEMALLTELQSSYASSAKVVSTVQSMFNTLLSAVGA